MKTKMIHLIKCHYINFPNYLKKLVFVSVWLLITGDFSLDRLNLKIMNILTLSVLQGSRLSLIF